MPEAQHTTEESPPPEFTVTEGGCEVTFLTQRYGETLDNLIAQEMEDRRRSWVWKQEHPNAPGCPADEEDYDQAIWQDNRLVAVIRVRPGCRVEAVRLDEEIAAGRVELLQPRSREVSIFGRYRVADDDERWNYDTVEGECVTLEDAVRHARRRMRDQHYKGEVPEDQVVLFGPSDTVLAVLRVKDEWPHQQSEEDDED